MYDESFKEEMMSDALFAAGVGFFITFLYSLMYLFFCGTGEFWTVIETVYKTVTGILYLYSILTASRVSNKAIIGMTILIVFCVMMLTFLAELSVMVLLAAIAVFIILLVVCPQILLFLIAILI